MSLRSAGSEPSERPAHAGSEDGPAAPPPHGPYLPPGRIVDLAGRGETFVRVGPDRPGAPTVLLLHGWLASADLNWFALYRPLAASVRLLAIDHRGHGRGLRTSRPFALEAAADDAAALIGELDVGPVIACGYSMGGPIALHLARRHPELVSGLVLCATALEWNDRWHERLQWRLLALVGLALRFGADRRVATRIIDEMAADDELVAAYRPYLLGEVNRLSDLDALAAGRALAQFDARPFAGDLAVPAAVVITRRDRLVRPRRQLALADTLDAVRFDLDADHDVFLRQPGAWAAAVTAAIEAVRRRLPGATASPTV